MPSYCPPTEDLVEPIYAGPERYMPVPPLSVRLFRHYKSRARQRNIYILVDGTVTREQPWDQSTIATTVFGGHINQVTAADLALLVAAGFPSSC